MTKTKELLNQLSAEINSLKIAGYLKEEVIASLKYLHWYKLKNIEKNLNTFCEYLLFLNAQNTEKIKELGQKTVQEKKASKNYDLSYFLAPDKLNKREEKAYLEKIQENGYELLTLMQGMKGILVLSIDEFCNASQTRMGIHQLLMQRESTYQKLHKKLNNKNA